ncbi:ferredoxin [Calderihabitans maritimus]|uniref:Ferredoxin n=1 Tax=Calderihabitans maritimus TaxID=1246530 RepID=A0A1Z5HT68_9FIRM|nr:ferredoxin [Calderihabitans maritimus]GAW92719.1 4Fe-4S ferredoxin [Calderihabitans maritimus]
MKVKVERELCISCSLCEVTCPEVFELDAEGKSRVMVDVVPPELESTVREVIDDCPVGAISEEE